MQYNIVKEKVTKTSYIMDMNTILHTEADQLNSINPNRYDIHKHSSRMSFNFFALNKYLKEFSFAIKEFN